MKQIGELSILRHDAGLSDSDICLGAACSESPKSELETLHRYGDTFSRSLLC